MKYVMTDALKYGITPDPFGGRGGWQCRLLVVHLSSSCTEASCMLLCVSLRAWRFSVSFNAQVFLVVVCFLTLSPCGSAKGGRGERRAWRFPRRMIPRRKRAPPARATNPKTGGRLTQSPAGTNPKTGQAADIFYLWR